MKLEQRLNLQFLMTSNYTQAPNNRIIGMWNIRFIPNKGHI